MSRFEAKSPLKVPPLESNGSLGQRLGDADGVERPISPVSPSGTLPPQPKGGLSDFLNRAIFSLIMAYGFLALIAKGVRFTGPVILLIKVGMYSEVLRINQKWRKYKQMPYFKFLPWYFLVITLFTATAYHIRDPLVETYAEFERFYHSFGLVTFGLYIAGFVAFVMSLKKGLYRYQIGQFTWIAMTLLFIVAQGSLQTANMIRGMLWFLLPVSCVVHNDIWAYVCGKSFGRTPLLRLSPKKTLEGFIGSWVMTTVWAFWFSGFMSHFPALVCPTRDFFSPLACEKDALFVMEKTPLPPWVTTLTFGYKTSIDVAPVQYHALLFAAFASLVAPFGGFFASGLKRAFKLKDFGNLIPGHGGMTDRMDCQIITGMFTYVYVQTFVYAGSNRCSNVQQMLRCIQGMTEDAQRSLVAEILAGLSP